MLINNINQANATPPIQTLLAHIKAVREAKAPLELMTTNSGANCYLAALRDVGYITTKEHYEYSRQLNDSFSSRNAELNHGNQ